MAVLVGATPSSNGEAKMATLKLHLCILTHFQSSVCELGVKSLRALCLCRVLDEQDPSICCVQEGLAARELEVVLASSLCRREC